MINYELNKDVLEKKIESQSKKETILKMKPKLKARSDFIEVKEIIILYPSFKKKVLNMQFNVAFRRLFKLVMNVSSDDATSSDTKLVLSEIERMKHILMDKYKQEFSLEEYEQMWKKAMYLEQKMNEKIQMQNHMMEFFYSNHECEEERGRGR